MNDEEMRAQIEHDKRQNSGKNHNQSKKEIEKEIDNDLKKEIDNQLIKKAEENDEEILNPYELKARGEKGIIEDEINVLKSEESQINDKRRKEYLEREEKEYKSLEDNLK